jgi:serine acetyltransferase
MTSLTARIRRGEGPVFGTLKRVAKAVLQFHIPVAGPTRWMFGLLYRLHVLAREAGTWAVRFFWYEPLFRSQCESVGPRFQMEALPYMGAPGRIVIGAGVRLSGKSTIGFSTHIVPRPELVIGDETFVGHNCHFAISRSLRIGRHCLLAGGVRIQDHDGHPTDADDRRGGMPTPPQGSAAVAIGDDVWVGAGAAILKGVTIGDRSIVAAKAVVTKDVPPDVVVAGNPARIVKQLRRHTAIAS